MVGIKKEEDEDVEMNNEEEEEQGSAEEKEEAAEVKTEPENKEPPEFALPLPEDLSQVSEEEMKKTEDLLVKGKFVADKYFNEVGLIRGRFTDRFGEQHEESYTVLQEFMEKIKGKRIKFDDDTRKSFAYHIEVCKQAIPELFETDVNMEVTKEVDLATLLKKAPRLTLDTLNEMIAAGPKVVKDKQSLLKELTELVEKVKGLDLSFRHSLADMLLREDKECWLFLFDNFDAIVSLFDQFGKSELVLLGMCKTAALKVIEFLDTCNENWAALGEVLEEKSTAVSTVVCGPSVPKDELENHKDLMEHCTSSRSSVHQTISDLRRKEGGADPVAVKFIKTTMSDNELVSYNFVLKELAQRLGKAMVKIFVPEEKIFVGYHLSKVKPIVEKMSELAMSRKLLEGRYIFKDHQHGKWHDNRHRGGGGGGGGRFSGGGKNRPEPWNSNRNSGGGNRFGGQKSFSRSFNHSGSY